MQQGAKKIYHLEAYFAKLMTIIKAFSLMGLADFDFWPENQKLSLSRFMLSPVSLLVCSRREYAMLYGFKGVIEPVWMVYRCFYAHDDTDTTIGMGYPINGSSSCRRKDAQPWLDHL
jgi:hypothetical protein